MTDTNAGATPNTASNTVPNTMPPPAQGVRLTWNELPAHVRNEIERLAGSSVVHADSQPSGFSPGLASRLRLAHGDRVFAKALSPAQNPIAPAFHRREAAIVQALPQDIPVPRLLGLYDEGPEGWIALVFEDIEGRNPAQPWRADELARVLDAMIALANRLTPAAIDRSVVGNARQAFSSFGIGGWRRLLDTTPHQIEELDPWAKRHIEALVAWEARAADGVDGDTLLHWDIRADNVLLTADQVWFVDWPHAHIGAPWLDLVLFAPSVAMQGGPPPEELLARHPDAQAADADAVTAVIVAVAGFFTYQALKPPPPGLPTLRAFQDGQAVVARRWIAQRTGLA